MDTRDRETIETVERAREAHRDLGEQLEQYRRDRRAYDDAVGHGLPAMPPTPTTDGRHRRVAGTQPRVIRGVV